MLKNTSHSLPKELARTKLSKGSALRVMQLDGNSRCCEVYTYSGWKLLDQDWAKELLLTYGHKTQKFIQKYMPELLEKKPD